MHGEKTKFKSIFKNEFLSENSFFIVTIYQLISLIQALPNSTVFMVLRKTENEMDIIYPNQFVKSSRFLFGNAQTKKEQENEDFKLKCN